MNAFNLVSRRAIFQELCIASEDIIQLIPFLCAFYTFKSPLFYSQHNHEGDIMVILFAIGIHQSDPLGGVLFVLIHFKALHFTTNCFPFVYFHPLQTTLTS
jgi:hypothetical protein